MSRKCGKECEVYSRVTGYFRPTRNWHRGKQAEFRDRKLFKIGTGKKIQEGSKDEEAKS